jgi:tetratricopeptide (TPR) repeat protein
MGYHNRTMTCVAGVLAIAALAVNVGGQTARVGTVVFPNSGAAAAQASFLYGLAQLHNFEYDDAARAFREAQQIDPAFTMAYWGEAMTRNHPVWMEQDLGGARRILERFAPTAALRLQKAGSERERAYLAAVEVLFGAGDKRERDIKYLDDMRRLRATYPEDIEASAFYALALLGSAHEGRDEAIYIQAAAVLEELYATHPDHPGVAHYLIHSYDDPVHAPLGLRAARKYFAIAPEAPHALHMTSHIYLAAGMWDDVVAANERATQVAAQRAAKDGRIAGGCGHPNMWLMYGYLQQGRVSAAKRILDGCRTIATSARGTALRAPEQDPLDPDNIPAGSYIQMWSRFVLDTDGWRSEVIAEEIPLGNLAGARFTRAFVRAIAAARRNDASALRDSAREVTNARDDLERVLADRRETADQYRRRADVLAKEIAALSLLAAGNADGAIALLRDAAAEEGRMRVEFGPPFVDKPAAELLGETLASAGIHSEAVAAFRTALKSAPNRTPALLGLARAAARAGDRDASADAYARLAAIWRNAEQRPADLPTR